MTCAGYMKDNGHLAEGTWVGRREAQKGEVCSPCLPWRECLGGGGAEGGCTLTIHVCWVAKDTVEIRTWKRNEELPKQLLDFLSPSPHIPQACTGKGSWCLPKAGCLLARIILSLLGQESKDTAELLCLP